jgi:C-terminal processing protease CtpA/Prc
MDVRFPTQRHIDSVNALGYGAVAGLIWADRAAPYEAYRTLTAIRHKLPTPVWVCTANHDSVHTAYARKEEEAIRRLLAETYAGDLSDSVLSLEPVEVLLAHVNGLAAIVPFDRRDEREDRSKPDADDMGLVLDTIGGVVYVTGVYPKSTAYEAGISIGDRITSVNGKLLATGIDWARRDIRRAVRRGGTVDLMVRRGNVIKRVTCSARPRDVGVPLTYVRVGIIAVERFGASHHAATQLTRVIERLMRDETHSIVIDLRGSYGGSMDPTLRVLELFARKGDTLARVWKHGRIQRAVIAKAHGSLRRVPVFICIDTATSGAAELFAQSMQQNRYATIVGLMSKGAMYEAEERHLTGTIGMRYVLRQFGRTVDARIQPDVLTVLPVDNVLRIRDAAAGLGDIRSWRQTTAGPDDGVIMDVGRSRPHVIRASDAETIAAVIYGNAARLYNLMSAMQPILLSTSPITKR